MAEVPSQELVVSHSSTDLVSLDEFDRILLGVSDPTVLEVSAEDIQRQIVSQLLNAESDEELEQFGNSIGWATLEGVPIRIMGFVWRPSELEEGAPVYVVVHGERLDTAENVILTTGGYNILAQLSNLARRGRFPAIRELKVSEKKTKKGFNPLWLVTPEAEKLRQAQEKGDLATSLRDESNPLDEPEPVVAKGK